MSLRLRRQNGHWLQTLKAEQHAADGVSNPIELEAPVDAEEPDVSRIADKKLKRAVQQAVKGTTLHPVFETIVKRTTRTLKARESEIELAVDDGEVRAGEASQELRDAELELKSGTAEGLLLAAETLLSGHELRLSRRSKAERGYRLAQGKTGTTAEPLKASPVHLGRDDTCRIACTIAVTGTPGASRWAATAPSGRTADIANGPASSSTCAITRPRSTRRTTPANRFAPGEIDGAGRACLSRRSISDTATRRCPASSRVVASLPFRSQRRNVSWETPRAIAASPIPTSRPCIGTT